MPDLFGLLAATLAGIGLGTLFFGGLWWTVRRALTSEWPASLFLASLLLRVGGTLAGFWWVSAGHWPRLLACLLGFTLARLLAAWWTRAPAPSAQELHHALKP